MFLAYGLPKETVAAIMLLYKNTKGLLIGWRHRLLWHCRRCSTRRYVNPIPVHNLPILGTWNVDIFNKRKRLYSGKGKMQAIPRTIIDADYADDIALLANTPARAESLLHSLEKETGGIGLHVNTDKINSPTAEAASHLLKRHQYATSEDVDRYH